jgi:DNA-binding NarL/FixJ family response regulator
MSSITLLVISNETITRFGLVHLLASEAGLEVRGDSDSEHAIEHASKLMPDVIVISAEVTRPSCAQLIASLHETVPQAGIVALGRETHHSYVGLLLASGALGYVLTRTAPQELFNAIRAASHGRRHIDANLSEELFELLSREAQGGTKTLSHREHQVLRMLAFGYTLKEISARLNISRKSIETYRARCQEKLGLRTRADIVRYALQTGMLSVEMDKTS